MITTLRKPSMLAVLVGAVVSKTVNKIFLKKMNLPMKIGKYKLVETIKKDNAYQEYVLGKYSDGKHFYFIKTWQGLVKDYAYYSLINEYFITQVLYNVLSRRRTDNRLYVPEVKDVVINKNYLSVVFEFVNGMSLDAFSVEEQKQYISFVLKELNDLNNKLSESDKKILIPYYKTFYIVILPIYALIALLRKAKLFKSIFRAVLHSYKILLLQDDHKLFIAHRDVTLGNLIISDGKVYLLDCERMVLTLPLYDYENAILDLNFPVFKPRLRSDIDSFFKYFIPLQMVAIETEVTALNSYARRLESL